MDISKVYKDPAQFLAITSLTVKEFDTLLAPFVHRWRQWYKHYNFCLERRNKPLSAFAVESPTKTLGSDIEKLFFILYIFKNHPLQQLAGATFGMNQGQVSKWVKILTPILEAAINDLGLQPARDMDELVRSLRQRCEPSDSPDDEKKEIQTMNLDVTERPIGRSTDYEAQRQDYSGKQKEHTVKNSVMCDEYQFVRFLGPTWRGAVHDKKMADEELPSFEHGDFEQIWLAKDTGYQGYCPEGIILLEPFKAQRGQPLTELQKEINTWVSSIRVVAEHAIRGIKKLRLVKEKWRSTVSGRIDQVMNIATGLHNLRIVHRETSYKGTHTRTCAKLEIFRS